MSQGRNRSGVNVDLVKIIRLVSGQEIICELTENQDGSFHLMNPLLIGITQTANNKVDLQLRPFLPFAKEDDVTLSKKFCEDAIVCTYTPVEEISQKYRQAFSNIILANPGMSPVSGVITE
jgi:hypothetical protein